MKDISYQEATTGNEKIKVGILTYTGAGDPMKHLKEAVDHYVGHKGYNEFIDANMDNPWVRVIIQGMDQMEQAEFRPEIHHL